MNPGSRILAYSCVAAASLVVQQSAEAVFADGVLTGRVLSTDGNAPVEGVAVVVTSPNLQGEQMVITDGSGHYRIPHLPPGVYRLQILGKGFVPYEAENVRLNANSTIQLNVSLKPQKGDTKERQIVVDAPTVDVGASSTGMSIGEEFTRRVPVSAPGAKGASNRSFEAMAEATPGATSDTFGTSISGATSPENNYQIDGISVSNPGYGYNGTSLSSEFVAEVNVVSGGYMPEYGRSTGGILSAITKSGSNETHGGVWSYLSPGVMSGKRKKILREGSTIVTDASLGMIGDVGFDIGGKIVKDKLWFYLGFDVARTVYNLDTEYHRIKTDDDGQPITDDDTGFTQTEAIPGTQVPWRAQGTEFQALAKLTLAPNADNKIALTAVYAPKVSGGYMGGEGTFGLDPRTGGPESGPRAGAFGAVNGEYDALAHRRTGGPLDISLKWSASKNNKKILFDTALGWHHERNSNLPTDGSVLGTDEGIAGVPSVEWRKNNPPHSLTDFDLPADIPDGHCDPVDSDDGETIVCPVTRWFSGGPGFISDKRYERFQFNHTATINAKWLGHHVIKAGADLEFTQYDNKKAYSGRVYLRETTDGLHFDDRRGYGFVPRPGEVVKLPSLTTKTRSLTVGAFLQDSWSIADKVTLNVGFRYDAQMLFSHDGELFMSLPMQWSPRVGMIWDPTSKGRSKIFANYAKFFQNIPLDIADRAGSLDSGVRSRHSLEDCDPHDRDSLLGACRDADLNVPQGSPTSPIQDYGIYGASKAPVDPDLKPQSVDEIVVGGEVEIFRNGRVGISYNKRWIKRAIEDMSRDEGQTFFIGNPGFGIAEDFPEAERYYDGVTFHFDKSWAKHWLLSASYVLSWSRGNFAGLFRPETGQLDPNLNSDFDLISILPNRHGALPNDRRHQIKLYAAGEIPMPKGHTITLGGAIRTGSGAPTNYYGSHAAYGSDEVFILPRGTGERLPWQFNVDANIGYTWYIREELSIRFTMDVFNVLNLQIETRRDETYTQSDVLPIEGGTEADLPPKLADADSDEEVIKNPNFGNPSAFQEPRTFRFGIRLTF